MRISRSGPGYHHLKVVLKKISASQRGSRSPSPSGGMISGSPSHTNPLFFPGPLNRVGGNPFGFTSRSLPLPTVETIRCPEATAPRFAVCQPHHDGSGPERQTAPEAASQNGAWPQILLVMRSRRVISAGLGPFTRSRLVRSQIISNGDRWGWPHPAGVRRGWILGWWSSGCWLGVRVLYPHFGEEHAQDTSSVSWRKKNHQQNPAHTFLRGCI